MKGASTKQNLTYSYFNDGMIQSITSAFAKESWTYSYDDLHRLLTATSTDTPSLTQSFTYNEIGNITYNSQIGTYAYPSTGSARPHAVTGAGSRTYQYNAIGQMTSRNGTVIQWNGDGKPSSIGNVAFTYDGTGTRLKKVSGGQTTRYIGGDHEIDPTGTVTKYLAGGKQVGSSFFIHHRDHLSSIQVVTNSSGSEVRRQRHRPFGDQHNVSGSHEESKGWIGEREEETELVYLNARYYDPEIGRFTGPDPLLQPGQGRNRYTYSLNNPVNLVDRSGLCPGDPYGEYDGEWCESPLGARRQFARIAARYIYRQAAQEERQRRRLNEALQELLELSQSESPFLTPELRGLLERALGALTAPGVTIIFSSNVPDGRNGVADPGDFRFHVDDYGNPIVNEQGYGGGYVQIRIRPGLPDDELVRILAHEGTHAAQYLEFTQDMIVAATPDPKIPGDTGNVAAAYLGASNLTVYQAENEAFHALAAAVIASPGFMNGDYKRSGHMIVEDGRINQQAINNLLRDKPYNVGPREGEQGPRFINPQTPQPVGFWTANRSQ